MYVFESNSPVNSESGLWHLQLFLMEEAESRLGAREEGKILYQPKFGNGPPQVINTPNLDGAFARLSKGAESSWEIAMYELAHETVHLLNPIVGNASYLEEGVAVAFSIEMTLKYAGGYFSPPKGTSYERAYKFVSMIPGDKFVNFKEIRNHFGSLSKATSAEMRALLPALPENLEDELCREHEYR